MMKNEMLISFLVSFLRNLILRKEIALLSGRGSIVPSKSTMLNPKK